MAGYGRYSDLAGYVYSLYFEGHPKTTTNSSGNFGAGLSYTMGSVSAYAGKRMGTGITINLEYDNWECTA